MIQKHTAAKLAFGDDPRGARWTEQRLEQFRQVGLLPIDSTLNMLRWIDYASKSDTCSVIVGPNGVGKSTAAELFADRFPERVIYVEAEPPASYSIGGMLDDIGLQLGVQKLRNRDKRRAIAKTLRADGRLLILDTETTLRAEHLAELRWIHAPHRSRGIAGYAPLLVIGSPQIQLAFDRCPAFASRIGYAKRVQPMTMDETVAWFAEGRYPDRIGIAAYEQTRGNMTALLNLMCHVEADRKSAGTDKRSYSVETLRTVADTYLPRAA